jgi:hypothetical protein
MLDTHLRSPVTRRRLRSGPAAEHIDAFGDWLHRQGYTPISVDTILRSLAGWSDWMRAANLSVLDSLAGLEACKMDLVTRSRARYRRGPNQQSLAAARLFIRFLREHAFCRISRPKRRPPIGGRCLRSSIHGCISTGE